MKQLALTTGFLALLAGCLDIEARPADPIGDPDEISQVDVDLGAVRSPEPPLIPGPASCSVALQRVAEGASCGAELLVRIECDRQTQTHTWARLGVFVDNRRIGFVDRVYQCDSLLVETFTIPCRGTVVVGAASFDHPQTAEDVHCLSPAPPAE